MACYRHHRVIIVVPKEIKHIHHYKYIHVPEKGGGGGGGGGHKHHHHHHHHEKVPQHHTPHKVHHTYEPHSFKQTGHGAPSHNNFPQIPVHETPNYNSYPQLPLYEHASYNVQPRNPVYETPVINIGPPSRQEIKELLGHRQPKLVDHIKPRPSKGFPKSPSKEANYLSFGFKTPTKSSPIQIQKPIIQKPKINKGHDIPKFDEPYKFQDPFVNAFPQLQQAFNIHSNVKGNAVNQAYSAVGPYGVQQNVVHSQSEPFDPYAHITHHPHGLVHINLGNGIDGQIKQIELNNNGEFQAHMENDLDDENENQEEGSDEETGGEEEGDGDDGNEEFEGFDDFLKDDNQKKLPYSGVMSHGRSLDSIYPKGPMVFSHEHYDVTPTPHPQLQQGPLKQPALHQQLPLQQHAIHQHPLQQHHLQQQPLQQSHLVTPSPAPTPLQPLYHRQFVPIQHLQAPSQEEHNQFVPLQNFNYNTFKK